jgi:hypothetical protein
MLDNYVKYPESRGHCLACRRLGFNTQLQGRRKKKKRILNLGTTHSRKAQERERLHFPLV